MKSHLRVKVFSMSAEMTYIRRQEMKWKNRARIARQRIKAGKDATPPDYAEKNFWSNRLHRESMKMEARMTHLAYGFMKGRSYQEMENICYGVFKGYGSTEPDWSRIEAMVERFSKDEISPQTWMQTFSEWLESAKKWYEGNPARIEHLNATKADRMRPKKPYVAPEECPF